MVPCQASPGLLYGQGLRHSHLRSLTVMRCAVGAFRCGSAFPYILGCTLSMVLRPPLRCLLRLFLWLASGTPPMRPQVPSSGGMRLHCQRLRCHSGVDGTRLRRWASQAALKPQFRVGPIRALSGDSAKAQRNVFNQAGRAGAAA